MTLQTSSPNPAPLCVVCSTAFKPAHPDQKTCSVECRTRRFKVSYSPINCEVCGKAFTPCRSHSKCCSRVCRNKKNAGDRETFSLGISSGSVGAVAELMSCAEMLRRGYEVFRSVSPTASCDLILHKDGITYRVEVRTARYANGKLVHPIKGIRSENLFLVTHSDQKVHVPKNMVPIEKDFKWAPIGPRGCSPIPG